MVPLKYLSGEQIEAGDEIRYHGERGHIEFVVTNATGDPALDWYLEQFPGGGAMIVAESFGNVFLALDDLDDFLEFVGRDRREGESA